MTVKPNIFPVTNPQHLALLDTIAAEIEGDRQSALGHILDAMAGARAMTPIIPPPDPRDAVDEWDPTAAQ